MYKAAKALNQNAGVITMFNGKVYKKRYEIKVLESSSSSEESISEEESTSEESTSEESTSEESTSEESTEESEESTSEESTSSDEESGTSEESTRGVKRTIYVTRRGTAKSSSDLINFEESTG